MRLLRLIEPQPNRLQAAFIAGGAFAGIYKPRDVPCDAEPYRDPNGLWFWAVPTKMETKQ